MCEICRQTPCHPRCPNAPEPKPVKRCCLCGEGIYEGDEYLITTDGCVCKDCLEDFSINQWLELIGEREISMDSPFEMVKGWLNSGGNLTPPAHPRCACAIEYIEVR